MNKVLNRYWNIYKVFGTNVMNVLFASYADFILFFIGKNLVFILQIIWLFSIFSFIPTVNGYTKEQVLIFLLVSYILDKVIQLTFFRGFFNAPTWINRGDFDKLLLLPVNSIFITAFRTTDWNDIISVIPAIIYLIYSIFKLPAIPTIGHLLAFGFYAFLGILVAFSILLTITASAFKFIRVDNLFLLYRDLISVTKFPPEIYGATLSLLLSTVMPILLIVAIPSKALLGLLDLKWAFLTLILTTIFFFLSKKFWYYNLRQYSSASS